jgi:hypothetical protein
MCRGIKNIQYHLWYNSWQTVNRRKLPYLAARIIVGSETVETFQITVRNKTGVLSFSILFGSILEILTETS